MNTRQRFQQLDALLSDYAWLWRPQPFKQVRPDWCERLPELTDRLLNLTEQELTRLTRDDAALFELLSQQLPALGELPALIELPPREAEPLKDLGPHFATDIPGRKWQQIVAFTAAAQRSDQTVLEWCGGKGHLGRFVSAQWQQPVRTLELQAELCREGERMAQRVGVSQQFKQGDALSPESQSLLQHHHPLALHACGGLHRRLLTDAIASHVTALDLAPCCYHLYGGETYRPFTNNTLLQPAYDDLRLAITETVTAKPRQVRLRDREMAWKLGFQQLMSQLRKQDSYITIHTIDKQWLNLDFAGFCHQLAQQIDFTLPDSLDWQQFEQMGWQRQHEVMRLSLVRHAFRRPMELWLVLDMVNHLQDNGYQVQLGTFCDTDVTPRNILISARKERQPLP